MNKPFFFLILLSILAALTPATASSPFMTNVYGRDYRLLNGKWNVIVDLYDQGEKMEIYKNGNYKIWCNFVFIINRY